MCTPRTEFYKETNYRLLLQQAFEVRKERRKLYSLRAFARDLGVKQSTLGGVMSQSHGLSNKTASTIAEKLGFNNDERDYFVALVDSQHSRSALVRHVAKERAASIARAHLQQPVFANKSQQAQAWLSEMKQTFEEKFSDLGSLEISFIPHKSLQQ